MVVRQAARGRRRRVERRRAWVMVLLDGRGGGGATGVGIWFLGRKGGRKPATGEK
jgi:hypothetical protein